MLERTFAIIKPDAVASKNTGKIIDIIEAEGFNILAFKKIHISKTMAEKFYSIHKERPFYDDLTSFMSLGPSIVLCLEKYNGIKEWRDLMGETNPESAKPNTLRKLFGESISRNAVHGSDSPKTAIEEITFFFSKIELV